jgi:hypothetical protein
VVVSRARPARQKRIGQGNRSGRLIVITENMSDSLNLKEGSSGEERRQSKMELSRPHGRGGQVICIIGVHRSGTSMVAGLLQRCGLYLGPEDQLLGANPENPEGHYEHTEFLRIDDALLSHFGGSWNLPPKLNAGWERDNSIEQLRQEAVALVNTFSGKLPWGWKEPRTTILLPFWKAIISQLRFVICVRSPLAVAKSLAKRDRIPIEHGVVLWHRYMRAAVNDTAGCPRIFSYYEDFFTDPTAETDALLEFCGLEKPSSFSPQEAGVRGDLWHHRARIFEMLRAPAIPAEYKLLYLGLRALSGRGRVAVTPADQESKDIAEYMRLLESLQDQRELARLQSELAERNNELFYLRGEMLKDLKAKHRWAYRIYRNFMRPFRMR